MTTTHLTPAHRQTLEELAANSWHREIGQACRAAIAEINALRAATRTPDTDAPAVAAGSDPDAEAADTLRAMLKRALKDDKERWGQENDAAAMCHAPDDVMARLGERYRQIDVRWQAAHDLLERLLAGRRQCDPDPGPHGVVAYWRHREAVEKLHAEIDRLKADNNRLTVEATLLRSRASSLEADLKAATAPRPVRAFVCVDSHGHGFATLEAAQGWVKDRSISIACCLLSWTYHPDPVVAASPAPAPSSVAVHRGTRDHAPCPSCQSASSTVRFDGDYRCFACGNAWRPEPPAPAVVDPAAPRRFRWLNGVGEWRYGIVCANGYWVADIEAICLRGGLNDIPKDAEYLDPAPEKEADAP